MVDYVDFYINLWVH